MLFLWCILVTTFLGVCFKLFALWKVNTLNAIVINYTVCLLLGTLLQPDLSWPFSPEILKAPWFKYDILLGFLFVIGFYLTAVAIQQVGITLATLMQRMSLIITVSFTVLYFQEHFGFMEFIALLLAVMAIVAINQEGNSISFRKTGKFPPILFVILLLSASIEILLFFAGKSGIIGLDQMAFSTHAFGCAAVIGWMVILGKWIVRNHSIQLKDVYAGFLLGVPNYFSIYLLMLMLHRGWKGSILYPSVNVSVLLCSTLVGVIVFREKLNRLNWIGVILATLAIIIIAYTQNAADWKIIF